jgi:hypothetical protein
MGTFMFNNFSELYRRGLAKKVDKAVWLKGTMSTFAGIMQGEKYPSAGFYGGSLTLKPTGKPFDLRRELEGQGGYELDVPVAYPLVDQGVIGTQQLLGNTEKRHMAYKKVHCNVIRHGVMIQDSLMSAISLNKPEIFSEMMNGQTAELTDWFGRKISFEIEQSLVAGASDNLTDPVFGLGVAQRSHPNFYVKTGLNEGDYTKAVFTGVFNPTYESACETALNLISGSFGALDIRQMVYLASSHKILGMNVLKNFAPLPIIFVHGAQARQLRSDPEWQAAQRLAGPRDYEKNQIFIGALQGYPFEGAYVVVDDTLPSALTSGDTGYASARGTVNYGAYSDVAANGATNYPLNLYMRYPRDTGSHKCAILVGAQASLGAQASAFALAHEDYDFGAKKEDGATMVIGWERSDIFNDQNSFGGTQGTFLENTSSLLYFTESPA